MITKNQREELELLIDDVKFKYSNFKYAFQFLTEQSVKDSWTELNASYMFLNEFLDCITENK
jgi:hypothetical protein